MLKSPLPSPKLTETDLNGRFKSILKKRSTFGDSDSSSNVDRTPSPSRKCGPQKNSQFYLPTPLTAPRKKVQFLMAKDREEEKNKIKIDSNESVTVAESKAKFNECIENFTAETAPSVKVKTPKAEKSLLMSNGKRLYPVSAISKSKLF